VPPTVTHYASAGGAYTAPSPTRLASSATRRGPACSHDGAMDDNNRITITVCGDGGCGTP